MGVKALLPGTSASKAEVIALTTVLRLGKIVFSLTAAVFAKLHVHGAIYRERGLLTSEGKLIKNKQEILDLLESLCDPWQVLVIHHPGHEQGWR